MKTIEDIKTKLNIALKKDNLKQTSQREAILEAMFANQGHFTPEEICNMVNLHTKTIGIATVYRALGYFEKHGIARGLSVGSDGKKYELCLEMHHDHIVCLDCGKIVEFCDDAIENAQNKIAKVNGFILKDHEMKLYGICKECQNRDN
ncbi:MAG: hypothetical protein RL154_452 [Pseudomonadota bacterium]|jgi:Fur family ferric uptake transcriptional regulator